MKKHFLSLFICIATFTYTHAQVSTMRATIEKTEDKEDTYVYDSLINIKRNSSYKYLKGQKLFYAASHRIGRGFRRSSNDELLDDKDMVGKYFNVIDVMPRDPRQELCDPLILLEDNSNDTIRYVGDWTDNQRWIVLGYYEKIKSLYEGKELVFMTDDPGLKDSDGLIKMTTQERDRSIPKESKWKCKAVSINQNEDPYSRIKGNRLILILENSELGEYYCHYENSFETLSISYNNYLVGKFLSLADYEQYKKDQAKRTADLIKKYGQKRGKMIVEGYIEIGMTEIMCIESWGSPSKINKTTGSFGVHEQWVYGNGTYVYFENGIITVIQNH